VSDLCRQETNNNSEQQCHTDERPFVCERFNNRSDLRKHNMIPCCTQRDEQIIEEDVNSIQCTEYVSSDCDQMLINRLESLEMIVTIFL